MQESMGYKLGIRKQHGGFNMQYTTKIMTGYMVDEFIAWYDNAIGTETETNCHDAGEYDVTCFEITAKEKAKIKRMEDKLLQAYEA